MNNQFKVMGDVEACMHKAKSVKLGITYEEFLKEFKHAQCDSRNWGVFAVKGCDLSTGLGTADVIIRPEFSNKNDRDYGVFAKRDDVLLAVSEPKLDTASMCP